MRKSGSFSIKICAAFRRHFREMQGMPLLADYGFTGKKAYKSDCSQK
jgi:hypothetical protein